ncbi:hypothetical protein FPV67DRAFT_1525908 [Lyophyllum atratum]|nr:hypothetical protein FPV67DRAFT_1525908 [Lyophyllum atratum]
MKLSATISTLIFALGMVASAPTGPSLTSRELAARSDVLNPCIFVDIRKGRCDAQGCRSGGGSCRLNTDTGPCVQVNMRKENAPVGCKNCTCKKLKA